MFRGSMRQETSRSAPADGGFCGVASAAAVCGASCAPSGGHVMAMPRHATEHNSTEHISPEHATHERRNPLRGQDSVLCLVLVHMARSRVLGNRPPWQLLVPQAK